MTLKDTHWSVGDTYWQIVFEHHGRVELIDCCATRREAEAVIQQWQQDNPALVAAGSLTVRRCMVHAVDEEGRITATQG